MRVLIVEDEKTISDLIRLTLCRAGYRCETAFDDLAAADLLCEREYDLVLLDVMLPGLDGFSLMESQRGSGTLVPPAAPWRTGCKALKWGRTTTLLNPLSPRSWPPAQRRCCAGPEKAAA